MDSYYENSDDQIRLIEKLLQDNDKEIVKFALKKLSNYCSNLSPKDDGSLDIDDDIFNMVLFYLAEDPDIKIKVLCSFYKVRSLLYYNKYHIRFCSVCSENDRYRYSYKFI